MCVIFNLYLDCLKNPETYLNKEFQRHFEYVFTYLKEYRSFRVVFMIRRIRALGRILLRATKHL